MKSKSSSKSSGDGGRRNRKQHRATISTIGRGLMLLGIATTSSSVDAFTSYSTSTITAIHKQSSSLQYRYGNDDDQPIDVLSAFRRRRRSHHVSSRLPSTTTSTPSPPPPTVELEQELDEYIQYLDRRYTRIHPKRSTSSIGRLGLSNLASTKLRQRLHFLSTSSSSSSSSSSALVITSYMRQVSDKFISSIKSMTYAFTMAPAIIFSVTSLVALLLVRPLLFGTFRQG